MKIVKFIRKVQDQAFVLNIEEKKKSRTIQTDTLEDQYSITIKIFEDNDGRSEKMASLISCT